MYSSLIDAFEEYRYSLLWCIEYHSSLFSFSFYFRFYKHELRHMTYLSEELDSGNVCPACPEVDIIFICIEIVPCCSL